MSRPGSTGLATWLAMSLLLSGCGLSGALSPNASDPRLAASGQEAFVAEIFLTADGDASGALSPTECDLGAKPFQVLDRNRDGAIDRTEWHAKATLSELKNLRASFKYLIDALFKRLDANGDGHVTRLELSAATGDRLGFAPSALDAAWKKATGRGESLDRQSFDVFYEALESPQDWYEGIVRVMLAPYLKITGGIAAKVALHPIRQKPKKTPASIGLAFEHVPLRTEDGLRIQGWFVPAKAPTTKAVVLVHGITSNREAYLNSGVLAALQADYNVLAIDQRNHGESEGTVTTYGYHEHKDVLAAVRYLKGRGMARVALMGNSLGIGGTMRAAALTKDVDALIEDSGYATVLQAFQGFASASMLPAPHLVAAAGLNNANRTLGVDIATTEPVRQVGSLAPRPFFAIHGSADMFVSPVNAQILFSAAGTGLDKDLWIVPGGNHDKSWEPDQATYLRRLKEFLAKAL